MYFDTDCEWRPNGTPNLVTDRIAFRQGRRFFQA